MATTNFIDKETIIEASWLNDVDATVYQALNGAVSPAAARSALDVPQETPEIVPQVRINGAWQALSTSVGPLHAATHYNGGTDQIDHDALLNGVGDKHVDHSVVEILGGSAMTGGGDLTATRTIAFSYILEQDMSADGNRVTNMAEPATNQDAATKSYVDNKVIEGGGTPWTPGVTPNSTYYDIGFVGIGTDTPIYDLDVRGTAQITGALIVDDDTQVAGVLTVDLNAGIGTPSPAATLHVQSVTNTTSWWTDASASVLLYNTTGDGTLKLNGTSNIGRVVYGGNAVTDKLVFGSRYAAGDANQIVTIDYEGKLGIGIAQATAKLHVVGNILGAGSITCQGTLGVTGNTTLDGASNVVNGDLTIQ